MYSIVYIHACVFKSFKMYEAKEKKDGDRVVSGLATAGHLLQAAWGPIRHCKKPFKRVGSLHTRATGHLTNGL